MTSLSFLLGSLYSAENHTWYINYTGIALLLSVNSSNFSCCNTWRPNIDSLLQAVQIHKCVMSFGGILECVGMLCQSTQLCELGSHADGTYYIDWHLT